MAIKEVTNLKKSYPSQENTKAMACRVPVADYVTFLQESIQQGITMNDWLLMKVYSAHKSYVSGVIEEEKEVEKDNTITIRTSDLLEKASSEGLHYGVREGLIKLGFFSSKSEPEKIQDSQWFDKSDLEEIIVGYASLITDYWDMMNRKKIASITDVKTQLIILINNKFTNTTDRQDYRRELMALIKELED
jgi:hypothetical protein